MRFLNVILNIFLSCKVFKFPQSDPRCRLFSTGVSYVTLLRGIHVNGSISKNLSRIKLDYCILLHSAYRRSEKPPDPPRCLVIQGHGSNWSVWHPPLGRCLKAILDADPYIPGGNGAQWYQNQNNLYALSRAHGPFLIFKYSFRSVRNFKIDVRLYGLAPRTFFQTQICLKRPPDAVPRNRNPLASCAEHFTHEHRFLHVG